MINFGTVKPGSTLYIPFDTFAGATGASITMTGLAVTDIEVYKDGSVTQRASDAGYTLLDTDGIDFDALTGIHGFSISLADNTTAGFWAAGSDYFVVVSAITVDTQTVSFIAARFRIGYPDAILDTTIATLASQTSFTLTAGPAEDDALNGCVVLIHDVASAVQAGWALVADYTGSTRTVTLAAGTTFTAATTDSISVFMPRLLPTVAGRQLDVSSGGAAGVDWANVETPGSTVSLSATTVATVTTTTTATNVTTVNGLAAGVITAAAVATGAIDADALAADAGTEIGTAVWASAARTLTAATNITDSGSTINIDGSGNVSVAAFTAGALAQFITEDTTAVGGDIIAGSVAYLCGWAAWDQAKADHTVPDSFGDYLDDEITSRMASYTQPTGFLAATFPATVASTTNITAGTITTVTNLTNAPTSGDLTATMKASVNTEVDAAIETYHLDHLLAATYDPASKPGAADALLNELIGNDGGVSQFTANALELAPSGGGGLTVQDIVDGVWDETMADHLDSGSTGASLNGAGSAGDPWTTALPGAYGSGTAGFIVGTNLDALITSRMATYTQPTGFLAATFPGGTVANTTNITAGTITTATNVTTVNGLAANVITAASVAAGAIDAATFAADVDAEILSYLVDDATRIDASALNTVTGTTIPAIASVVSAIDSNIGAPDDLGSGATIAANLGDIESQTDDIGAAGAGLTALATAASVAALPTAVQNADALLGRNIAGGSSTGRTVAQAFASLRNRVEFDVPSGGSFTVFATDDSTPLWTGTYSTDAGADPVIGVDPT